MPGQTLGQITLPNSDLPCPCFSPRATAIRLQLGSRPRKRGRLRPYLRSRLPDAAPPQGDPVHASPSD
jgi:hypothetical protein